MRAAGGGGCTDAANLQKLHDNYKCGEYHFVSADTGAHADVCKRIKDAGMLPVYDIEMAVWVASGFNVGYDINFMRPQLQAIKDAGWVSFSSEGISAKQVSVLREYLPYINYGGERGEDVYSNGSMYYRPRSMADGNYNETYHKESVNEYHAALKSASAATPNAMGVTLMLYTNATLEMDNAAMVNFIQAARDNGVNINTVLFWAGVNDCPTGKLDGAFNSLYHALDAKFGFTLENIADKEAQLEMWVVDSQVDVNEDVAMGGRLIDPDGAPIAGQSVEVMHYVNYDTGRALVQDGEKTTDDKGEVWYWFHGTRHYVLSYYLHFKAANGYKERWAGPLDIYVHQPRVE